MSDAKIKIRYNPGIKLYRYDGDDLTIYRVFKYDPKTDKYLLKKLNDDTTCIVDHHYAHNDLIKLNEDGIVSFNVLSGERKDVMVCIHRKNEFEDPVPFAICRQDVVDIFKMYTDPPKKGTAYAGISVNKRNCPAEMKMEDFMLCDDVLYTKFVHVYLEDTLDDILGSLYLGRFDKVLKDLEKYRRGSNIYGYQDNVRDLLVYHNFMYDFHEAFNVIEVPFPIVNEAKDLLKDVIGQIEQKVISEVYIMPYSKMINLSEFARPYKLITPEWNKCKPEDRVIFIVAYDIDESKDYLKEKYGTSNKDEIIKKLGFSVM